MLARNLELTVQGNLSLSGDVYLGQVLLDWFAIDVWTKAGQGHKTCPARQCPLVLCSFIQREPSKGSNRNKGAERWSMYANIRFWKKKKKGSGPISSSEYTDFCIYANIYLS